MVVNETLKTIRDRKYNQEEIAKKLFISDTTYWRKENSKNEFTLPEALRLSILLDVPIEVLFKELRDQCLKEL